MAEQKFPLNRRRSKILPALRKLSDDNVQEIKFLLEDQVDEGILEKIQVPWHLYKELEKLQLITTDSLDFLFDLLREINREDIVSLLQERKSDSKVKGRCFILNNYEFPANGKIFGFEDGEDTNLSGYIKDAEKITETFKSLNFDVKEEKNKTAEQMIETVENWCELKFTDDECVVVFLLSHGGEHGALYGCDGQEIPVDDIISKFCSCKKLKGKPKLFIVQACRGDMNSEPIDIGAGCQPVQNDMKASGRQFVEKFRDTFVYYSSCEGFRSFVSDSKGSIFISELCKVLDEKESRQYKLWELVTKVNKTVSGKVVRYAKEDAAQCPEAVYRLHSDFSFSDITTAGSPLIGCIELRKKNPCYVFTNTKCGSHVLQCRHFGKYKTQAVETFADLNFHVYEKDNLSGAETSQLFKGVKYEELGEAEGLVCVVFSCGGLNGQSPVIFGTDGKFYSIETMMKKVTVNKDLRCKPKLFFMVLNKCNKQSFLYEGEKEQNKAAGIGRIDIPEKKSQEADTFIYYVTIDDGESYSEFISILSEVLQECRGTKYHLGDIVLKVNEKMHELKVAQIPEACSTLTSLVYFAAEKTEAVQASDPPDDNKKDDEVIKAATCCNTPLMQDRDVPFNKAESHDNDLCGEGSRMVLNSNDLEIKRPAAHKVEYEVGPAFTARDLITSLFEGNEEEYENGSAFTSQDQTTSITEGPRKDTDKDEDEGADEDNENNDGDIDEDGDEDTDEDKDDKDEDEDEDEDTDEGNEKEYEDGSTRFMSRDQISVSEGSRIVLNDLEIKGPAGKDLENEVRDRSGTITDISDPQDIVLNDPESNEAAGKEEGYENVPAVTSRDQTTSISVDSSIVLNDQESKEAAGKEEGYKNVPAVMSRDQTTSISVGNEKEYKNENVFFPDTSQDQTTSVSEGNEKEYKNENVFFPDTSQDQTTSVSEGNAKGYENVTAVTSRDQTTSISVGMLPSPVIGKHESRTPNTFYLEWNIDPSVMKISKFLLSYKKKESSGNWTVVELGNVRSATVKNLSPWQEYDVKVKLESDGGATDSHLITVLTLGKAPGKAPTKVVVKDVNYESVTLQWEQIEPRWVSGCITQYAVRYGHDNNKNADIVHTDKTQVTVQKLQPGTEYKFQVAGETKNATGMFSDYVLGKTKVCVITDITSSFQNMEKISCKLDVKSTPNWKNFGMVLVDKYAENLKSTKDNGEELKLTKNKIESLRLAFYGGGSPSLNLLNRMSTEFPEYNLLSLSSDAKELRRKDISNLVDSWSKTLFTELSDKELITLSEHLDKGTKGLKNWRHFADRIGYSNDDIKKIEASVEENDNSSSNCSPTSALLGLVAQINPHFQVKDLRIVASIIGRNDVADIFDTIMNRIDLSLG